MKTEENFDQAIIELARILDALNQRGETTLATASHGVGSRHVQGAKHCTDNGTWIVSKACKHH